MNSDNPWRNIPSEQLVHSTVSEDDFKRHYLGEFKPDERFNALIDRVKNYRDKTEYCSATQAAQYYGDLKLWVVNNGYTIEEFNHAKRIVSGMR